MKIQFLVCCVFLTIIGCSTGLHEDLDVNSTVADGVEIVKKHEDHSLLYRVVETLYVSRESLDEFPDFVSQQPYATIIAFILGIYCFTFLALLCDGYFLPTVEALCVIFNISEDIAAATFMSMATSAPEFFVNIVSTFISESDLGLGTIVGSSSFNTLFTPALGCLAVTQPLQIDYWPVTRDASFYMFAIALLVVIIWDGKVEWYEALVLFIVYIIYFFYIFLSTKVGERIKDFVANNKFLAKLYNVHEEKQPDAELDNANARKQSAASRTSKDTYVSEDPKVIATDPAKTIGDVTIEEEKSSLFTWPKGGIISKIFFVYTWPLRLILACVMPNHIKYPKLTPITFLICVACIGMNSYIVSWMVTIIGNAFNISDTVMGFTLSAAGGALPEAFSLVIKARKGEGAMGVSNSFGANTMNILLSLGFPWLISTISRGANLSSSVQLESESIQYSVLALIVIVLALYFVLMANKFRLTRISGIILLVIWVAFLSIAITIELTSSSNNSTS